MELNTGRRRAGQRDDKLVYRLEYVKTLAWTSRFIAWNHLSALQRSFLLSAPPLISSPYYLTPIVAETIPVPISPGPLSPSLSSAVLNRYFLTIATIKIDAVHYLSYRNQNWVRKPPLNACNMSKTRRKLTVTFINKHSR